MAKLVLYGPDGRHGTTVKKGFRRHVWYIRFADRSGKVCERSTGCGVDQRVDAEKALGSFLLSRADEERTGPRNPHEVSITDVLSWYLEDHARTVADPARIAYCVRALMPYWSAVASVGDINRTAVNGYTRSRERQGVGRGTIRRELGCLSASLKFAEREGRITRAPFVDLPQAPPARDRWLSRRDIAALIRAARKTRAAHYLPTFILLAYYTGARKEAVLSLQWAANTTGGWVDLEGGKIWWKPSATKKQRPRATPIPPRLARHLAYVRRRTQRYVLEYRAGERVLSVKRSWSAIVAATGVDATPHTLRHTAATHLMQAGVPVWEAAGFLGMTTQTLERKYGHHHPDFMGAAVSAIACRGKRAV